MPLRTYSTLVLAWRQVVQVPRPLRFWSHHLEVSVVAEGDVVFVNMEERKQGKEEPPLLQQQLRRRSSFWME